VEKIIKALQDIHPERDYSASSDFIEDAILDSFDVIILVVRLEDCYGIKIDGADVIPENFKDLTAISSLVARYLNGDKL
jgi:acyl carrier protein